jgi:hypothetical protein
MSYYVTVIATISKPNIMSSQSSLLLTPGALSLIALFLWHRRVNHGKNNNSTKGAGNSGAFKFAALCMRGVTDWRIDTTERKPVEQSSKGGKGGSKPDDNSNNIALVEYKSHLLGELQQCPLYSAVRAFQLALFSFNMFDLLFRMMECQQLDLVATSSIVGLLVFLVSEFFNCLRCQRDEMAFFLAIGTLLFTFFVGLKSFAYWSSLFDMERAHVAVRLKFVEEQLLKAKAQ